MARAATAADLLALAVACGYRNGGHVVRGAPTGGEARVSSRTGDGWRSPCKTGKSERDDGDSATRHHGLCRAVAARRALQPFLQIREGIAVVVLMASAIALVISARRPPPRGLGRELFIRSEGWRFPRWLVKAITVESPDELWAGLGEAARRARHFQPRGGRGDRDRRVDRTAQIRNG